MQVLIEERQYRRMQRIAKRRGQSLAEWVRQALRAATREEPDRGRDKKLAAVRAATAHAFPTADIDTMLSEIERGYAADGAAE
jgi:hypothetical protein